MPAYFDHNATTALFPEARERWLQVQDEFWHNASSLYREAGIAKRVLEDARETLGDALGADPERVVFTSGATEANHLAIQHLGKIASPENPVQVGRAEHPSVIESVRLLDEFILVGPGEPLGDGPCSRMAANNESGEILDRPVVAGMPRHCDAAQWIGRLDPSHLGETEFVTGSAHKFGGPKGVGFLIVPEDSGLRGQPGGPQEQGRRGGTEDVAGIAAMAEALTVSLRHQEESTPEDLAKARDRFESIVCEKLPGTRIIAGDRPRLWNTSLLLLPAGVANLKLVTRLGILGFATSTGSACSAGVGHPSPVLAAEGVPEEEMGTALRLSAGWDTTDTDWEQLADTLVEIVADLGKGSRKGSSRIDLGNL